MIDFALTDDDTICKQRNPSVYEAIVDYCTHSPASLTHGDEMIVPAFGAGGVSDMTYKDINP